ncbi:MAG: hypothetical protein JWO79_2629 [Actinomycetia bacterium]|nr:hypothetical protein [Actinomycetes bacterium]
MRTLLDVAGGQMGGARRFADELDGYRRTRGAGLRVAGSGRMLSIPYLARREARLAAEPRLRRFVALNNYSAAGGWAERWVLLRNALHFLRAGEKKRMPPGLVRRVEGQARLVTALLRRADVVVVPTRSMHDRVLDRLPWLADRTVVRAHPLTPPVWTRDAGAVLLCPVLFAPFKDIELHLRTLAAAVPKVRAEYPAFRVQVTCTAGELRSARVSETAGLEPAGRVTAAEVDDLHSRSSVLFYPGEVESFGYPAAEARLSRTPVVGLDTATNREVAGDALVPFGKADPDSLAQACIQALRMVLPPLAVNPFDPVAYFDWLSGAAL